MTVPISVVIPVGPLARHSERLQECLQSVREQSEPADEILVIDNGTGLREPLELEENGITLWRAPWAMGLATGFNAGVGLARNELVFCLGSDDTLYPRCLDICYRKWQEVRDPMGWYYVGVRYSNGFEQNTPCLAAMVTKSLWKKTGGFALGWDYTGSCEIEFISKYVLTDHIGQTYKVSDDILYWTYIHTPGSVGVYPQ